MLRLCVWKCVTVPESRNICPVERADGDGRAEAADHGRAVGSRGNIRAWDRGYRAEQPCSFGSCKKYSARQTLSAAFGSQNAFEHTRDTRTTAHTIDDAGVGSSNSKQQQQQRVKRVRYEFGAGEGEKRIWGACAAGAVARATDQSLEFLVACSIALYSHMVEPPTHPPRHQQRETATYCTGCVVVYDNAHAVAIQREGERETFSRPKRPTELFSSPRRPPSPSSI